MVANETGLADLSLETIWNVYDTLFCEVSRLARGDTQGQSRMQLLVKPRNFPGGEGRPPVGTGCARSALPAPCVDSLVLS